MRSEYENEEPASHEFAQKLAEIAFTPSEYCLWTITSATEAKQPDRHICVINEAL
jgi:hypothetical protein